MKRIVLMAIAALACCWSLLADTDENGLTPTYWCKFNGNLNQSGSETFSIDGGKGTTYVDTFADQAYKCTSYPWCSGLSRGNGDFTVVTGAQTVNLNNGIIWAMGTRNSLTGFALVSKGATQVALRIFGSSWSSSGEDVITADVPDATTAVHVYTIVYSESARKGTLYVDNTVAGTTDRALSGCQETNFQFASLHGNVGYGMVAGANFLLDDFRVYRQALTAAEIANIVPTMVPPVSSATVAADTRWSEIDWQPALTKPAYSKLHLTVQNNVKIAFDAEPAFNALTVDGTFTVAANGLVARDVAALAVAGAPYSHWFFRNGGTLSGTFAYDPALTFPAGYTAAMEVESGYGLRLVVTAPETAKFGSISVNFKENDAQAVSATADYHGAFKVPGTVWNDLAAANGLSAITRYTDSAGVVQVNGAMAINVTQVANGWRRTGTLCDNILTGYLDDSKFPRITVASIPFARYRIIAYRSTDGNGGFGPFKLGTNETDARYYHGGTMNATTLRHTLTGDEALAWGAAASLASGLVEGVNYVVSDVLSGGNAFIDSPIKPTGTRCSVPAFQIVEVGQVLEEPIEYTATVAAAGAHPLSALTWSPSPFSPVAKDLVTLTIDPAVEGEVVVNLDDANLRLQKIAVVSPGSATLRLTGSHPAMIEQWDLSQVQGKITFDFVPTLSQVVRGAYPRVVINAPYTGVVRSGFEFRGTGNVLTMPAAAQSGMDVVFGGSGTFTGAIVDNEYNSDSSIVWDGTYTHEGNAYLAITDGNLTITPDAHVTVPHIRTINSSNTANDGTMNIAGTVVVDSESDANCYAVRANFRGILLGHWAGVGKLNVTGALVGTNTWMEALFTVTRSEVDIDGGLVQVRGVSFNDRAGCTAAITVRNGGTLQLAEGLSLPDKATWTFDGGNLKAYRHGESTGFTFNPSNTTFTGNCTIDPNGQTITLPGAISGSGTITIRDSSDGANGKVVFDGNLDNYNGTIHFANGTYDLGSLRQVPAKLTFGADVTFVATQTHSECGSGESIRIAGLPDGVTVTLNRLDGTTEVAVVESSTATFAGASPRIDGAACFIDVTFTNLWDMTHQADGAFSYKAVPGAILKYDTAPLFANTNEAEHAISERGVYIRHHPYIDGIASAMNALSTFTAVVVGQMSPSAKTTFIHFGSSTYSNAGLLIATTEAKDEVMVARTQGNAVYPIKTLSVPNSSSARHVYIVSKHDVPATEGGAAHSVFDVYLDGVKRATVPMDGIFTLGVATHCGVQVGSDFGGTIRNAGTSKAVSDVETEVGVINVLRIYDYELTSDQVTLFTTQYPYVPEGGLFTREFTGGEQFSAASTWTKSGEGSRFDAPIGTGDYDPSATLAATGESTITINTSVGIETLTLNGAAMAFVADGEHALDVTGATVINTDVTVAYGAINLGNAPVMLGGNGSLTFDLTGLDIGAVYVTTDIQLTGLMDESERVQVVNPPSGAYRTAALVYAEGQYFLRVTPNHEAGERIYLPGGVVDYTDATIVKTAAGEDTVAFPGDILVMREAGMVQLNHTPALLDHLEVDATNLVVRMRPGTDGAIFNGERLSVLSGTLMFSSDVATTLGAATLTLGANGTLGTEVDLVLNDNLTLNAETAQTIFAPADETVATLSGTGAIIKTGAGTVTLGCRLQAEESADRHPLAIQAGTLTLAQSGKVGVISGAGTLNIPADVTIAAADPVSVTNVVLAGAGTLKVTEAVALRVGAEWSGNVEFLGEFGEIGVPLQNFSNLPNPVKVLGLTGTRVWMTSYTNPAIELAGTMMFNDYNLNATYTYPSVSGAGEIQFLVCESKQGLAGATIAIQKLVGTNIVLTAIDNHRIAVQLMQVEEMPALNHRLIATTTGDQVSVNAVQAGEGAALAVPLQVRTDGLYVTLPGASIQVTIGEDVYASAQDAIAAVKAAGKTLLQVEAYIIEGAEIPAGYYRKSDGRLLPREPSVLFFR